MGIESAVTRLNTLAVPALSDADRNGRDSQARRDGKDRREREAERTPAHPVRNDQGQVTGKLIDVTA
jgi:hypothetical protein